MLTIDSRYLGGGRRLRFLLVLFCVFMILLPSSFFAGGQDTDEPVFLRVAVQEDIISLNPLVGYTHHWTWLMTQWLYDTPIFTDRWTHFTHGIGMETNMTIGPYIATGSGNCSDNIINWGACNIGEFDYTEEASWADAGRPEAVIFYDFTGVLWHDGVQMDIDDVLFSYHVAAQHPVWHGDVECLVDQGDFDAGNYSKTNWLNIRVAWESQDHLRAALKFNLQKPYNGFFDRTLAPILLPEHLWNSAAYGQAVDGTRIWCDAGYAPGSSTAWNYSRAMGYEPDVPVGSGPFIMTGRNMIPENQWQVVIHTWRGHFFDRDYKYRKYCLDSDGNSLARQPHIDGINFQVCLTNNGAITALLQDLIDVIGWSVPPTFVQELANEPGIALRQSPEQGYYYAAYNMNRRSFGYDENGTDQGKVLRRAIAHCIDKNRLVQRLLLCFGIGGEGPVSSISSWFNETIPRYTYDPDRSIDILKNAGYRLTYPEQPPGNGNWWLNPDGSPIGSGENGEIILVSYMFTDFRCPQVNSILTMEMQNIGLNVMEINYDYGDVQNILQSGNYDMVATRIHIGTEPSEYLYNMFHSQGGENYWGYNNASFDKIIELTRSSDDPDIVKQAVEDAQASIVYDLPMDVLYYRTNIEAYRSDRFIGWSVGASGSIFNGKSLRNIRMPLPQITAAFVSPPSAVVSNSTGTQITILVRDPDGNPLSGAYVVLNASWGKLGEIEGNTSSNGKFTTTFTAPYADPNDPDTMANGTQVIIQIKSARYWGQDGLEYGPAPSQMTLITVYPEDVPFLSVTMSADPDIIDPDYNNDSKEFGFTYVGVEVTDQDGNPVQGAIVAMSISPAIPHISPAEAVTDADGKARFTITAVDEPNDSGEIIEYQVTAYSVYSNYKPGDNTIIIQVVDAAPPAIEPAGANSWAYYMVLPAALIGIFLLMVAMLIYCKFYTETDEGRVKSANHRTLASTSTLIAKVRFHVRKLK